MYIDLYNLNANNNTCADDIYTAVLKNLSHVLFTHAILNCVVWHLFVDT